MESRLARFYFWICVGATALALPCLVGWGLSTVCVNFYRAGNRYSAYFIAFSLLYLLPTIMAILTGRFEEGPEDKAFAIRTMVGVGAVVAGVLYWAVGPGGIEFLSSPLALIATLVVFGCIVSKG